MTYRECRDTKKIQRQGLRWICIPLSGPGLTSATGPNASEFRESGNVPLNNHRFQDLDQALCSRPGVLCQVLRADCQGNHSA